MRVLKAAQTRGQTAERAVFVDRSGRRALAGRVLGVSAGIVVVVYLAAFVFSLLGVSWVPPVDLPLVADPGPSHDTDTEAHEAPTSRTPSVDRYVSGPTSDNETSLVSTSTTPTMERSTSSGKVVAPSDGARSGQSARTSDTELPGPIVTSTPEGVVGQTSATTVAPVAPVPWRQTSATTVAPVVPVVPSQTSATTVAPVVPVVPGQTSATTVAPAVPVPA